MTTRVRDRFDKFWTEDPNSGCHCWGGGTRWGYGVFWFQGRSVGAHRWIVEVERGPIPPNMIVDHLCRNRCCVNVEHLEVVTQRENCRRRSLSDVERGCPHGHPFDRMQFTPWRGTVIRYCLECQRIRFAISQGRDPFAPPPRERSTCRNGGHAWPEHLRIAPNGKAFCGECKRDSNRRQTAQRKAKRAHAITA